MRKEILYETEINSVVSDNLKDIFNLIDKYENDKTRKIEKSKKPPDLITPKEFLTIINGTPDIKKDEIFINPINQNFKKMIEKIYKNKSSTKQKAAEILYSIIKNKNFKFENKKIALACFIRFLEKNKLVRQYDEKEKRVLFLMTLLIEKSSVSELNRILNLIENFVIN